MKGVREGTASGDATNAVAAVFDLRLRLLGLRRVLSDIRERRQIKVRHVETDRAPCSQNCTYGIVDFLYVQRISFPNSEPSYRAELICFYQNR